VGTGASRATAASASVTYPCLTISPRTQLRRLAAFSGLRSGVYSSGPLGRPARSAASPRLTSSTSFPKYSREASWMPYRPWPK